MSRLRLLSSVTLLAGALVFLRTYDHGDAVALLRPLDELPLHLGEWDAVEGNVLDREALEILEPTDYVVRRYRDAGGNPAWLYVGYWSTQRKGAQIHSPKHCLPGGGWEPLEAGLVSFSVPGRPPRLLEVNRYVLQKGNEGLLVLYWFEAQGEPVAGEVGAKLRMVRSALLRNRTDGAIVRVSTPIRGDVEASMARLESFVRSFYPSLQEHLPR